MKTLLPIQRSASQAIALQEFKNASMLILLPFKIYARQRFHNGIASKAIELITKINDTGSCTIGQ